MSTDWIRALIVGLGAAGMLLAVTHMVIDDHEKYIKESECVQRLIDAGVARKDIGTKHGTCYLKEYGH